MNYTMKNISTLKKEIFSAALFPLYLVNFIGVLGFSMVIPFLYILVQRLGGSPVIYGLISASYPLFQLVGAPLLGRWSDRIGRKKVLIVSQAGTFIAWAALLSALYLPHTFKYAYDSPAFGLFVLTLPLVVIFFSRAFDGLTGGNVAVANAFLADLTPAAGRSKNYGRLSISSNLGFVIGPALAGLLGGTVYREALPIFAALVISAIAILVIAYFLPEKPPKKPAAVEQFPVKVHGKKMFSIFRIEGVLGLFIMYFFIFFAFNTYYTAFPVHVVEEFRWDISAIGYFFSVLSLLMILVQGPLLQSLSGKTAETTLVLLGSFLLIFNFGLLVLNAEWGVYSSMFLFALGNGLMWPSFLSLLSQKGTEKNQGQIQGTAGAFGSLASIAGLIVGGAVYAQLGANIFSLSVLSILIVTLYFLASGRQKKTSTGGESQPKYCSLLPCSIFLHNNKTGKQKNR